MAAKKDEGKVVEDKKVVTTNKQDQESQVPESAKTHGERTGEGVRTPTVGEPVETSFDERTSAQAPWLKADGAQDNGAVDLSKPEGARASQSREGNKTTVEETEQAIKDGTVEGKQDLADLDKDGGKPKNPVK